MPSSTGPHIHRRVAIRGTRAQTMVSGPGTSARNSSVSTSIASPCGDSAFNTHSRSRGAATGGRSYLKTTPRGDN
jgi:hypothetical protein